jgi:hypothetical protein
MRMGLLRLPFVAPALDLASSMFVDRELDAVIMLVDAVCLLGAGAESLAVLLIMPGEEEGLSYQADGLKAAQPKPLAWRNSIQRQVK